jgi:hypothetical protein
VPCHRLAHRLDQADDGARCAIHCDVDPEVRPVTDALDRAGVVAGQQDRLAPGDLIGADDRAAPVASRFWQ